MFNKGNMKKRIGILLLGVMMALPAFGQFTMINIGTQPNDQTGDPLRVAFQKVNANFALLSGFTSNSVAFITQLMQGTNALPLNLGSSSNYPASSLTAPGGVVGQILTVTANGIGYSNAPVGGSGTATNLAFDKITSGANVAATMTVGTGGSLGTSGSGTIAATTASVASSLSSGATLTPAQVTNALPALLHASIDGNAASATTAGTATVAGTAGSATTATTAGTANALATGATLTPAQVTNALPALLHASVDGSAATATSATTAGSATTATTATTANNLAPGATLTPAQVTNALPALLHASVDGSAATATSATTAGSATTATTATTANNLAPGATLTPAQVTNALPAVLNVSIGGNAATASLATTANSASHATTADSATTATTATSASSAASANALAALSGLPQGGASLGQLLTFGTLGWGPATGSSGSSSLGSTYTLVTNGTVYFASPTGSSTNNGLSLAAPWTISYAVTHAGASNTILLVDGEYGGGAGLDIAVRGLVVEGINKNGPSFNGVSGYAFRLNVGVDASGVVFQGLHFTNCQYSPILLHETSLSNCIVRNNWVEHTGATWTNSQSASGIQIYPGVGALVEGNLSEWNGTNYLGFNHGIYAAGTNGVYRNNVCRYNGGYGIIINGHTAPDVDNLLYQNLLYGNVTGNYAQDDQLGVYADNSQSWAKTFIYNNTIISTGTYAVIAQNGNRLFTNNIIISKSEGIHRFNSEPISADYNLAPQALLFPGAHDVVSSNYGFVNSENGLYWLNQTSAARGAALTNIFGPVNFFGAAQSSVSDIGAFQFNSQYASDTRSLVAAGYADYWKTFQPTTLLGLTNSFVVSNQNASAVFFFDPANGAVGWIIGTNKCVSTNGVTTSVGATNISTYTRIVSMDWITASNGVYSALGNFGTLTVTTPPLLDLGSSSNYPGSKIVGAVPTATSATTATTASGVPFSGVTAATSAAALVIGSGGSLGASGTGTITATALASTATLTDAQRTNGLPTTLPFNVGGSSATAALATSATGALNATNSWDWTTNTAGQTTLTLGQSVFTNFAANFTVTGLANLPNNTERGGRWTGFNTSGGTVTVTTPATWHCSDYSTVHYCTNGNSIVLVVDVILGTITNCAVSQFR